MPAIRLDGWLPNSRAIARTIEPGKVGIYCCGPTVYGLTHLGNTRAAVVPDVMVRFLRHEGYEVKYVRNLTDIDDKIIAVSQQEGIEAAAVAERYIAAYHQDLAGLNMVQPDVEPRVSDHIPQILELVGTLIDKGLAYPVEGDVYYRVRNFAGYGKLSHRPLDELLDGAGSRVEVDQRKESPLDFALWKAAKPGEPSWESPWGPGRPGWHIECSAMSSTHLGDSFDIHCGGRDLIFPHHENEIAQSQGAHGEDTFSRFWVHNGFINFDGEKMSKSLGNFFTTRQITALYDPETVRYFLLTVHYRSGLNFDLEVTCPACQAVLVKADQERGACPACGRQVGPEDLKKRVRFPGLEEADDRLAYIYGTLSGARKFLAAANRPGNEEPVLDSVGAMVSGFVAHLRNDFNTGGALGVLSKPLSEVNGLLTSGKGVGKAARYRTIEMFLSSMDELAGIFGCFGQDPDAWLLSRRDGKAARIGLDIQGVEALLNQRQEVRAAKDWEAADRIRAELTGLGVAVQDGPEGSSWSFL